MNAALVTVWSADEGRQVIQVLGRVGEPGGIRLSGGCVVGQTEKRASHPEGTAMPQTVKGVISRTKGAEVELGYRLRQDAWGKGYATEGSRALVDKVPTSSTNLSCLSSLRC